MANPADPGSSPPPPFPGVPTPIVIRKYANRRLYDTSRSCHITQDDLYDLVAGGQRVQVIDVTSEQDITNQILAQALIERDPAKLRLFPTWPLHIMIRSSEQMLMPAFMAMWGEMMRSGGGPGAGGTMPGMGAGPGSNPWAQWWSRMVPGMTPPATSPSPEPPAEPDVSTDDEVDAIRAQLDALAQRLQGLERDRQRGD